MFSQNNPLLNLLASSVSDWSNKEHSVNNNNNNNIIINEYNKEFRTNDLENNYLSVPEISCISGIRCKYICVLIQEMAVSYFRKNDLDPVLTL